MQVVSLFYYPVKSMRGLSLSSATLDDFGIQGDRRFMLIDDQGSFITQRKYPVLSKFLAQETEQGISILDNKQAELNFSLSDFILSMQGQVWGDCVDVLAVPFGSMPLLDALLGRNVTLAYMPESSFRQVDREFFNQDQRVGFADAFPLLLTNMASLNDLNSRLDSPVEMSRFRPNIIIDGDVPFAEDDWQLLRIGGVEFECVKPCSRCVMTTIDESGVLGKEPLKTLATYRKNEFGVCFGENLVHLTPGVIKVGDKVELIR